MTDREARKRMILKEFDRMEGWEGISKLAAGFKVSRQWISQLLLKERREAYRAKCHPTYGAPGKPGRRAKS